MRLDDYLNQHRLSQADFAAQLVPPVTQGAVSQWITGETRVSLQRALEIKRLTKGKVTVEDCASMAKAAA